MRDSLSLRSKIESIEEIKKNLCYIENTRLKTFKVSSISSINLEPNSIYFETSTNTIYVTDENGIAIAYGSSISTKKYYFFWADINGSITANVWQRVSFKNKITDNDNVFDGSTFRPIEDGIYVFGGLLTFNMQDAQKLILAAYKNGSFYGLISRGTTGKTDYSGFNGLITIPMVVGDYLEMYVYSQSGSYAPISKYNYIQGWKLL